MSEVRFTSPMTSFLMFSIVLFILGFIFMIPLLCMLAVLPLSAAIVSLFIPPPSEIKIERDLSKTKCRVGDEVEVEIHVRINKGIGFIIIRNELPKPFELIRGNNIHVVFKGLRRVNRTITFAFRCTKRGEFTLPALDVEIYHILYMKEPIRLNVTKSVKLQILPPVSTLRRMRFIPTRSRVYIPLTSISRMGPVTSDFKEIREYRPGDPFKFINWKATARNSTNTPMVNEFEREGKKNILILLDCTSVMLPGTELENPLEYAISATAGLVYYLTRRAFNVMLGIIGHGIVIPPGTGAEQYVRVINTLVGIKGVSNKVSLDRLLKSIERWIVECIPLTIIITNLTYNNLPEVVNCIKFIGSHVGKFYRKSPFLPILIIDVSPYYLIAKSTDEQNIVLAYSYYMKKKMYSQLRRLKVMTIRWDIGRRSFNQVASLLLRMIR